MASSGLKTRLKALEQAQATTQKPTKGFLAIEETETHYIGADGTMLEKPADDYIVIIRVIFD